MKKLGITFLWIFIIILAVVGVVSVIPTTHTEYLRIHVRANSNSEEDQAVKYQVKEALVNYLTPYLAKCDTKLKAYNLLTEKEKDLESVADKVLYNNGYDYHSDVEIKKEAFPTRVYEDYTLEEGIYDALIVNLGSGKGDNWWCVVYPPLCFVNGVIGYQYKSKLKEIIESFYNKG